MELNTLARNFENHEKWAGERNEQLVANSALIQQLRMDIHGAKIGGRVALGITLALGGLVGWLVGLVTKG